VEVARFGLNLERELLALQCELQSGEYQPGGYLRFTLYERKPRLIAAAPFRDRVVHHALMNIIEPPLDRTFIHDSYACRVGKGTHAAVARYQTWARRYPYVLKMDIAQYFPSIDHAMLREKLRQRIKDKSVLALLDRIIDRSPVVERTPGHFPGDDRLAAARRRTGIPIGNLTSQFFANLYLDDFDHYMKETLRCKAYLRYVDDTAVLDDDKRRLHEIRAAVRERLAQEHLRLHPCKADISRVSDGLNLLGYIVFPNYRRMRSDNGHRFVRRLRRMADLYRDGRLGWTAIDAAVQSWIGHAQHAMPLPKDCGVPSFRGSSFSGERTERRPARDPRLFLERETEERSLGQP